MPYWGSNSVDNDFAFDAVGAYAYLIKERLFQDAENVIKKSYPEQGIIASLECLRLIARNFPKCVKLAFGRSEFRKAKEAFDQWYGIVKDKLPKDYKEIIKVNAEEQFALFESEVLLQYN